MQAISPSDISDKNSVVIHKNIKPEVDIKEVLRFLGAGKSVASARTLKIIMTLINETRDMIKPVVLESEVSVIKSEQNSVQLSSGIELKSPKLARTLNNCQKVKVFVATVGEQVEEKINKLMDKNRFAEATIMDAIASVAVENTVDSYQSSIDLKLKSRAMSTTLRFSPGYCDWDIKEQHKLFDTVDTSNIGVALNENSLMSPRKSISGVFGIGSVENVSCKTSNPCMSCGKTDCIARRTEN